jgi:hypothetical protein
MTALSLFYVIYFDIIYSNRLHKLHIKDKCPFSSKAEVGLDSTILALVAFKFIVIFYALNLSMTIKAGYSCIEIIIFANLAFINCYSDFKLMICAALLSIGSSAMHFMHSTIMFNLRMIWIGITWKERESRLKLLLQKSDCESDPEENNLRCREKCKNVALFFFCQTIPSS